MKRIPVTLVVLILAVVALSGCAAGNPMYSEPSPAGFWAGIWHGMIIPITFIISLFEPTVEVYERANNGGWYDLGFVLGVGAFSGGSRRATRKRQRSSSSKDEE